MAERPNQQSSSAQSHETRQPARTQSGIARRHPYDPFLMPFSGDLLNPFSMMRHMMEDFDRAWGSMSSARSSGGGGMWTPAVEVSQRGDHFVVSAELPGLNKDDVH